MQSGESGQLLRMREGRGSSKDPDSAHHCATPVTHAFRVDAPQSAEGLPPPAASTRANTPYSDVSALIHG